MGVVEPFLPRRSDRAPRRLVDAQEDSRRSAEVTEFRSRGDRALAFWWALTVTPWVWPLVLIHSFNMAAQLSPWNLLDGVNRAP